MALAGCEHSRLRLRTSPNGRVVRHTVALSVGADLAGKLLSCGCVVVFLMAAASLARAQTRNRTIDDSGWHFVAGAEGGPTIVAGNARQMTKSGLMLLLTFGFESQRRWSIPVDFGFDMSNLPTAVRDEGGEPNAESTFILFGVDPKFALARSAHWTASVTGGGGLSWKQVAFLQPSSSCGNAYGCYTPTSEDSSFQPAVDGGGQIAYDARGRAEFYAGARYVEMFTPIRQFPGFQSAGTGMWEPVLGCRIELGRPAQP